jgi:hypothetical protein
LAAAVGQKKPGAHGNAAAEKLPAARLKPAAPAEHAVAPPVEKVPAAQAFVVPTAWPAPHQ